MAKTDMPLRAAQPVGWFSTDAEEIDRRRQRGVNEAFEIVALEADRPVFGTFRVVSTESTYIVEITALHELSNMCDCPDHQINGLGTCKHVEAVLAHSRSRTRASQRSPRIEITLDRLHDQVRVMWPARGGRGSVAARAVGQFFASDNVLLTEPITAFPSLVRALAVLAPRARQTVRISRVLEDWLRQRRRRLQRDDAKRTFLNDVTAGKRSIDILKQRLHPYQCDGMVHLAFTERALLADEMGLGKTIQAIAACELLRRLRDVARVLVICPASLKAEWEEQIQRFSDAKTVGISGSPAERRAACRLPGFFYLANYEQILADGRMIHQTLAPDIIVLDEAQRIKNWHTKTAAAVKRLTSRYAFILTGTPLENRIDELYSIVQFLDPGIFGPLFRFNRDFYRLDANGKPIGYKNLDRLHQRLRTVMLRRRKGDVDDQIPGRSEKNFMVAMHPEQVERYEQHYSILAKLAGAARRKPLGVEQMKRLQRSLACMRMICDSPFILDEQCRVSPKIEELRNVLEELLEDPDNKIIIFSEWERMLQLVATELAPLLANAVLHSGKTSQKKRRQAIERFRADPDCRVFLSTDAGSTGLNLQNANVVVNLDLPWNSARFEQRIARAWRKQQTRKVQVLNFISEATIESRMLRTLDRKQQLADTVIDAGLPAEMDLPSGAPALLERIEALACVASPDIGEHELPSTDRAEQFAEDCVARFSDRLDRLQLFGIAGREHLLAVVDDADEALSRTITALAAQTFPGARLELLDRPTYALINRLTKYGIVHLAVGRLLHERSSGNASGSVQERRQITAAIEIFRRADRPRRMSQVLREGGFGVEALAPMGEVLVLGLAAGLSALGSARKPALADSETINLLVDSGFVFPSAPRLLIRFEAALQAPVDAALANELLTGAGHIADSIEKALQRLPGGSPRTG